MNDMILTQTPAGRIVLHLRAMNRNLKIVWHLRGILRELRGLLS